MSLTPHFSVAEFASHDGTPYPQGWVETRLLPLCTALEFIRAACGDRRILIVSGYRTVAHNKAVHGAQHSQHVWGRAADITVEGVQPNRVHATIIELHRDGRIAIGGLGLYPYWVHVDVRPTPGGHLAQWYGVGVNT